VTASLFHRLEAHVFLIRAAVALALHERSFAELDAAERLAIELAKVPSAWTQAHAHCLRAGIASSRGDDGAEGHDRRAARPALDEAGMILQRVLVDDALGTLLGGDEGAASCGARASGSSSSASTAATRWR
jgi:hypothetical protein